MTQSNFSSLYSMITIIPMTFGAHYYVPDTLHRLIYILYFIILPTVLKYSHHYYQCIHAQIINFQFPELVGETSIQNSRSCLTPNLSNSKAHAPFTILGCLSHSIESGTKTTGRSPSLTSGEEFEDSQDSPSRMTLIHLSIHTVTF